ncbi:MAG: hypothetical protein ACRDK7_00925 [Solirubrobacteraceae bacterium]
MPKPQLSTPAFALVLATMAALATAPAGALADTGHAAGGRTVAGKGAIAAKRHRAKKHAAAPTAARKANVAATRAYIAADYALVHTARVNLKTGEAALESLRRTIGSECPKAALASPENEAAEYLSNEVVGAMGVVFIRSDIAAVTAFAEAVTGLRWSDGRLTRKVVVYAGKLQAIAALREPDVCGDVRAWAGSGYKTLQPTTTQFDREYSANDVGIGEVPARLLAPYENRRQRGQLALTKQSESELVDAEARAVGPWSKILDALDLQP